MLATVDKPRTESTGRYVAAGINLQGMTTLRCGPAYLLFAARNYSLAVV